MSEQAKKPLLNFMKKQISEKSSKINATHKSEASNQKSHNKKNDESKNEEEIKEEELKEAKKESINKAAGFNQAQMMKKLALETFAKYTLLVVICVIFVIGFIQFGPAITKFLNGIIFKALMSTLHN